MDRRGLADPAELVAEMDEEVVDGAVVGSSDRDLADALATDEGGLVGGEEPEGAHGK